MAIRAPVELDFLGVHHHHSSSSSDVSVTAYLPSNRLLRRRSFCEISKINPEIVKSVIASAAAPKSGADAASPSPNRVSPPLPDPNDLFKPQPFVEPYAHHDEKAPEPETAPFTVFYNGTVSVFDLPKEKAEGIIKFAAEKVTSELTDGDGEVDESYFNSQNNNESFLDDDGDLPMKRKRSLHRFFEKRKERLISYPIDHIHVGHLDYKTSV